jgi:type I restriction enzyme S subunit
MSEWLAQPLGSLATFQKGRKVETSEHPREGFAPYLGASAISGIIDEYGDTRLGVIAGPGDVLMLWDGERSGLVGKAQVGVISSTVARLSPKSDVEGEYLYYALSSKFEWIQGRRTGTGVPHVPKDLARILSVKYPKNRNEQRRIVEILSTLDEAIEKTEALIAKMQQVKAGLMHDLFTRGVTPDGHLRPSREQAPDLYKESALGWIPKEWEVATLPDKARPGRPHLKTGPFGSSLKIEHWVETGHPVITIGALGEGEFIQSDLLYVNEVTAQRLREYQLDVGDVVFSRVADVGRSAVILNDHRGWIMSSNLMRISLDQSKVYAAYLQSQLAHDMRVRAQIRSTVNSSGREVANSNVLNRLRFAWPQIEEQARILYRAEAFDDKRVAEVAHQNNLTKQKWGLMHDLLTGRVRTTEGVA